MGCNNTKTVPVRSITVVSSAGSKGKKRVAPSSDSGLKPSKFTSNPDIFQAGRRKGSDNSLNDDEDSLFGNADSRHSSAGSKGSKHSGDSGFDNAENMWDNIITEESDPTMVEKVENEFCDQELDLCVQGTSVRQMKADLEVERREERDILRTLHQEGLLVRPESRAQGGVSFEIMEDPEMAARRPPPRLAKLELRQRKKKKRELTATEIEAKLAKAEERRKRKEQERIDRINAKQRKEQDDVLTALEAFQEHQKRTEEGVFKRLGSASENRDKRMKELRDKLQAKREHDEIVRQRKLARKLSDDKTANSYEDEEYYAQFKSSTPRQFDPRYDDEER